MANRILRTSESVLLYGLAAMAPTFHLVNVSGHFEKTLVGIALTFGVWFGGAFAVSYGLLLLTERALLPPEENIGTVVDPNLESRLYLINMISGRTEELGPGIYAISLLRNGRQQDGSKRPHRFDGPGDPTWP